MPISLVNDVDPDVDGFDTRLNYWGGATGAGGYGPASGTGTGDAVGRGSVQIGTAGTGVTAFSGRRRPP